MVIDTDLCSSTKAHISTTRFPSVNVIVIFFMSSLQSQSIYFVFSSRTLCFNLTVEDTLYVSYFLWNTSRFLLLVLYVSTDYFAYPLDQLTSCTGLIILVELSVLFCPEVLRYKKGNPRFNKDVWISPRSRSSFPPSSVSLLSFNSVFISSPKF